MTDSHLLCEPVTQVLPCKLITFKTKTNMDDSNSPDIREILGNSVPENKKKDDFSAYIDDT